MIRRYNSPDNPEWLRMRRALWPDIAGDAHRDMQDAEQWLARHDAAVFVFARDDDRLGGFLEVGERVFADGCETQPVGYIEGWFVDADLQGQGIGRELMTAAEQWAKGRGYREPLPMRRWERLNHKQPTSGSDLPKWNERSDIENCSNRRAQLRALAGFAAV